MGLFMTLSNLFSKATLAVASALFATTAAFAHPALLSSSPADKSQGPAPAKIELKFSETLTTQFSGANLIMTGMPGMPNHGAMKINASVAGASDAAGAYRAAAIDGRHPAGADR